MNKKPPLHPPQKRIVIPGLKFWNHFLKSKKKIYEVLHFEVIKKFTIFQFKIKMDFANPYPQYQQSRLNLIDCEIWSVWPLNFRLCYAGARLRWHERAVLRAINQGIWKLCKYCIHHSRDKPAFNQSSFPTLWSKPTWDWDVSEWATASCN